MKNAIFSCTFISLYAVLAIWSVPCEDTAILDGRLEQQAYKRDTAHYWRLKAQLDPHAENIRIDPGNYEDEGTIDPPSGNDPCNTGYDELCGIYVMPDPSDTTRPYFSQSVNSDIFYALKKNEYLEGKVFLKDL